MTKNKILMRSTLTMQEKQKIKKIYLKYKEKEEKINASLIQALLLTTNSRIAQMEIVDYIKEIDKNYADTLKYANAEYVGVMPSGHIVLTDKLFNFEYLHRYVVLRELGIEEDLLKDRIVHHIDGNKSNNLIENLYVFYSNSCHVAFHQALRKNKNININEFNLEYVTEHILTKDNADEVAQYLKLLDKLQQIQNNKKMIK